jgi:hypothetical protein
MTIKTNNLIQYLYKQHRESVCRMSLSQEQVLSHNWFVASPITIDGPG